MSPQAVNYLYWGLLVLFGVLGLWHAISPAREGHEWRNATAALMLYVMMGIIGLRYFLAIALLLVMTGSTGALAASGQSGHRNECHHNAKNQLVCRACWHEAGKVRCGQPRIVR